MEVMNNASIRSDFFEPVNGLIKEGETQRPGNQQNSSEHVFLILTFVTDMPNFVPLLAKSR
jgi:hypothetical protein